MQKPDEVPAEGLVRDTGHPPARSLACLPPGVLARQGKRAVLAVPKCPWPPMLALSPPAGKALAGQRLPRSRPAGPSTCPKDLQVQRASQRNPSAWRRCSPCSRSLTLRSSPLLGRPVAGWQHGPGKRLQGSYPLP